MSTYEQEFVRSRSWQFLRQADEAALARQARAARTARRGHLSRGQARCRPVEGQRRGPSVDLGNHRPRLTDALRRGQAHPVIQATSLCQRTLRETAGLLGIPSGTVKTRGTRGGEHGCSKPSSTARNRSRDSPQCHLWLPIRRGVRKRRRSRRPSGSVSRSNSSRWMRRSRRQRPGDRRAGPSRSASSTPSTGTGRVA